MILSRQFQIYRKAFCLYNLFQISQKQKLPFWILIRTKKIKKKKILEKNLQLDYGELILKELKNIGLNIYNSVLMSKVYGFAQQFSKIMSTDMSKKKCNILLNNKKNKKNNKNKRKNKD